MRQFITITILLLIVSFQTTAKNFAPGCQSQDSTIHERFIVHLLEEYEKKGHWLFISFDSCGSKDYRIVDPKDVFFCYTDRSTDSSGQFFAQIFGTTLLLHGGFGSCPEQDKLYAPKGTVLHQLKGELVNMKIYRSIVKKPKSILLETYFDKSKNLKSKYIPFLNEIIAACYTNNIEVITSGDNINHYEIFK